MPTYQPRPLDTSRVSLSPEQSALLERLASNAHEVWAAKRVEDGWSHGPARDDALKKHPCLVPYEQLPESEKAYDRVLVEQVMRAIIVLGYRIERS